MSKPAASRAMDSGPSSQRRDTSPSRVSSPNAAKMAAEADASAALTLRGLGKVLLDQRHHHRPAAFVRRERLRPARERNAIEAGLGDGEQHAIRRIFEREDDQRRRLA